MYTKNNRCCPDRTQLLRKDVYKMSTSMVRIPDELKEKLENLKETYRFKTVYEVIDNLIEITERQKIKIGELQQEIDAEKQRRNEQDVYLGSELKGELLTLTKDISLRSPADAISFLIANYDGLRDLPKLAFMKYIELKK